MSTGEPTAGTALADWLSSLPFRVAGALAIQDHVSLPLVEEIAQLSGLCGSEDPALDARLRRARCNKYLMQEEVKKAGLASVRQLCARSPSDVQAFAEAQDSRKVVVKPFLGMGGGNVTLLDYAARRGEAEAAVGRLFDARPADQSEYPILVQEYVEGDEYAVDLVAREGHIVVASVAKYDRRPLCGAPFVMFSSLLAPVAPGSKEEQVATYAAEVAGALGMRNGPAHVEVKHCSRRGAVLVELNAHRFNANRLLAKVAERALGYNQMIVFLDSLDESVSAEAWRARYPALPPAKLRAFGGGLNLHARRAGVYAGGDEAALAELQALPSVFELTDGPAEVRVGQWMEATENMGTVPVKIGLCSDSEEAMLADYKRVFEIEEGMFAVS